MEKNEKNQELPAWVKLIADFPAPCQQSIGNLCAQIVQNLSMIALISADLYDAVCHEVEIQSFGDVKKDADTFVKSIVNDALNDDPKTQG